MGLQNIKLLMFFCMELLIFVRVYVSLLQWEAFGLYHDFSGFENKGELRSSTEEFLLYYIETTMKIWAKVKVT